VKIYKQHIYGVMGTLVFHILLFSAFLLADVNIKGNAKEEEILIEFPDLPAEPELQPEEQEENQQDKGASSLSANKRSNIASNRTAKENTTTSADKFFDADYQKEIEAAQNLRSDVSSQLAKDIVDMSDIKMPVETTDGMTREEIKNVIYSGESNIVYYLENRYHVSLPIPVYLTQGGGTIIVDIKVNRKGRVIEASPRKNTAVRDEQVYLYAKEAALRTVFNRDDSAPSPQKGSIHYTFVAQ